MFLFWLGRLQFARMCKHRGEENILCSQRQQGWQQPTERVYERKTVASALLLFSDLFPLTLCLYS